MVLIFCREIQKNTAIKKILLTGQADENTAVDAFNEGLIDAYIQKCDTDFMMQIRKKISQFQIEYFQMMSAVVSRILSLTTIPCLHDERFYSFFENLKKEHNIVEYYLIESTGSFLLFDRNAKPSVLLLRNANNLSQLYELALAENLPASELEAIKHGKKISQSHALDDLLPATRIDGEYDVYYCAYIQNPKLDIKTDQIVSYGSYMKRDGQVLQVG